MEIDSFYLILFFLSSHFRYKFFFADDYEAVVNVHFPSKEEGIEYFERLLLNLAVSKWKIFYIVAFIHDTLM